MHVQRRNYQCLPGRMYLSSRGGGKKHTLLPKVSVGENASGLYIDEADLRRTTDYVMNYIRDHDHPEEGAIITAYMEQYDDYYTDLAQMAELQTVITGTIQWMINIRRTITVYEDTTDVRVSGRRRLAVAVQAQANKEEAEKD